MGSINTRTPEHSLLEALAQEISTAAHGLTALLQSTNPAALQDGRAGSHDIPRQAPAEVSAVKAALIEKTMAVQQLVMSATDVQQQMTLRTQHMASVRWICRFKVADFVPADGSISYDAVAAAAGVPADQLARICRMAMTAGFFREVASSEIAHSHTSLDLRSSCPVHDAFNFLTETGNAVVGKMTEMTEAQLAASREGGKTEKPITAFGIAKQTDVPFFKYIMSDPELARHQAAHMNSVGAAEQSHVRHVLNGYAWADLPSGAKVIDVGGSTGHCCVALAQQFPSLNFVVQDLPPVLSQARIPEDLKDRILLQAHDFLTPQPSSSQGAEVFFIRQCLQNWPHKDAVRILQNIIPAMDRTKSRIVIMSVVLSSPSDPSIGQREKGISRMRDLFMMQAMGGQERDMQQWETIVKDADPELEIVSVEKPRGSVLSMIDVRFKLGT
ncbi:putative O-methyltransferase [Cladophialophora carrionii]|uniref:Putative O-methyltransferase n=1 Tax=Cladophialophora carrionii TaxID=86049 RepID=A0A1C1CIB5_9EURO|nr:putative O-methyltransferase [Cladophialophora carrionii]